MGLQNTGCGHSDQLESLFVTKGQGLPGKRVTDSGCRRASDAVLLDRDQRVMFYDGCERQADLARGRQGILQSGGWLPALKHGGVVNLHGHSSSPARLAGRVHRRLPRQLRSSLDLLQVCSTLVDLDHVRLPYSGLTMPSHATRSISPQRGGVAPLRSYLCDHTFRQLGLLVSGRCSTCSSRALPARSEVR